MAFFVPPTHMIIHIQFNLLYQFWIHTELVRSLGPLEHILNTAKHHRVHHGMFQMYPILLHNFKKSQRKVIFKG